MGVKMNSNDTIICPGKPDMSTKVFGDAFTADELFYLRMRDPKCKFVIDTLVNDAFRNGMVFGDEEPHDLEVKELKKGWKWAMQYGWSLVVFLDGTTKDLGKPTETQPLGIQVWHPYVTDVGGVQRWDTDADTGLPSFFYIKPFTSYKSTVKVDAKRTLIMTHGDQTNGWQGYTALGALYDPATGLRMWLGTALRRARDYSTARYLIQNKTGSGPVDAATKADIAKAFSGVPHAVVNGEWKTDKIGGPVDANEASLVVDQANKDSAVSIGVSQSDMTGSQAGAKLSTDADTATYFMTAKDVQVEAFPYIQAVFSRLGVEVEGFKSASELPAEKKLTTMVSLMDLYTRCAPELKEIMAERIESFMLVEFGQEVTVQKEEVNVSEDARGIAKGFFKRNSKGTTRET
jgi:hypothetical protein